jgi:hypothetical protein
MPAGQTVQNRKLTGMGFVMRPDLAGSRLRGLGRIMAFRNRAVEIQGLGDLTPPSTPAFQPSGPTSQVLSNVLTQQPTPSDPMAYASPQAAVAAGLNADAVYTAWSQALAQFPTTNDALAAGIPSGVINQLWTASRAYVTAPAPKFPALAYLAIGGVALVALVSLSKKKEGV